MKYEELNNFILNYIEYNKTRSAIMLTGAWGTGKSYYIENILKDFLKSNNKDCIVVSLYGLNNLYDLSKSIFLETKISKIKLNRKLTNIGIIAGKTVINGVASRFNVDLSKSKKELNELYNTVDLTDKLVVLEDVERTDIDIIELMGYINSLTDRDGVKVLLVANEEEITKEVELTKEEEKGEEKYKYTENNNTVKAYKYYKIKEKTISDTIVFEPNLFVSIESILNQFNEEFLNKYKTEDFYSVVKNIFSELSLFNETSKSGINFRTFIYATQKFVELIKLIDTQKYDEKFIDSIYLSIINFSKLYKLNHNCRWSGNINYSIELGYIDCPLYRFCFDYIVSQKKDNINIDECYNDYLDLYNHQENINVFRNYSILTENEVVDSLKNLETKIDKNKISLGAYGELLYYLVLLEKNIEYDISSIIKSMKKNVIGQAKKLGSTSTFYYELSIEDPAMKQRYSELSKELISVSRKTENIIIDISYNPKNVEFECSKIGAIYSDILRNEPFLIYIDVNKYSDLFISCSSAQMLSIRVLFRHIYSSGNIKSQEEFSAMKNLIDRLNLSDKSSCDKIQILQLNCFLNELSEYCKKLN